MKGNITQYGQPCPIRDVLNQIGGQWSLLILEALSGRTVRFNVLNREVEGISRQMLTRTLRRLEEDGYIDRKVFAEVPPRVEYSLTELGDSFMVPLRLLIQWADEHHSSICRARTHYHELQRVLSD